MKFPVRDRDAKLAASFDAAFATPADVGDADLDVPLGWMSPTPPRCPGLHSTQVQGAGSLIEWARRRNGVLAAALAPKHNGRVKMDGSGNPPPGEDAALEIVRAGAVNHYTWGPDADGWRLVDRPDFSVIEESVPPQGAETMHEHRHARQFFYVISGQAEMRTNSRTWTLGAGDGFEVPPGVRHQFANVGAVDVRFLVISCPPSRGDRTEAAPPSRE